MSPTFASFLLPAGIIVAAAIVTGLIEVLKAAFPLLDDRVSGAAQAFVLTAILYIFTALATSVATPDAGLAVFTAWLACAMSAIGIKSSFTHLQDRAAGIAGPAAPDPVVVDQPVIVPPAP